MAHAMTDPLKDRVDLRFLSGVIFVLSMVAVVAVCITTAIWRDVHYVQRDTWSAALFHFIAAVVAVLIIALVIIPAALLYSRTRWRLGLASLFIAVIALLFVCAEFFSLFYIHLKPGLPAG